MYTSVIWSYVKALYFLANAGGQSSLADYCTYFVAYSDGSCTDMNSARAPDRMLGEVRGSSSRSKAVTVLQHYMFILVSASADGVYLLTQVYGFIPGAYWVCSGVPDSGEWLLSASMHKQLSGGMNI